MASSLWSTGKAFCKKARKKSWRKKEKGAELVRQRGDGGKGNSLREKERRR